jgi:hypothetical protein
MDSMGSIYRVQLGLQSHRTMTSLKDNAAGQVITLWGESTGWDAQTATTEHSCICGGDHDRDCICALTSKKPFNPVISLFVVGRLSREKREFRRDKICARFREVAVGKVGFVENIKNRQDLYVLEGPES